MSKDMKSEEMSMNTAPTAETVKPQTVPIEVYETLYNNAMALEARYKKLLELHNIVVEAYLAQK